jgi:hypothetical protein
VLNVKVSQLRIRQLVVLGVTVLLGLLAWSWPASSTDEMMLLLHPVRMMQGDLPYRDFFGAYGPAHFWILEGVSRVAGADVRTLRVLGLVVHAVLALSSFTVARRYGAGQGLALLSGLAAAWVLFYIGLPPLAWITAAALVMSHLALLSGVRGGWWRPVAAGACAGLAISVRPDALLLALLPAGPLVLRTGRLRAWAAGVAVGVVPLLLSLFLTPRGLLHDVVLGRASRGARQSALPLIPDDSQQRALLAVLLLTVLLLVLAAAIVRTPLATAVGIAGVLALPQALQRAETVHFLYAGMLSLPFLPQALHVLVGQPRALRRHGGPIVGALGVSLLLIGTTGTTVRPLIDTARGQGLASVVVEHDGRSVPESGARATHLRALLEVLDRVTTSSTTLFVFDENMQEPALTDLSVYYLMPNVRQSAFTLEVNPGVSNAAGSRLSDDVRRADVLVLIHLDPGQQEASYPYERPGSSAATEIVRRHFCSEAEVAYYRVLRRCAS